MRRTDTEMSKINDKRRRGLSAAPPPPPDSPDAPAADPSTLKITDRQIMTGVRRAMQQTLVSTAQGINVEARAERPNWALMQSQATTAEAAMTSLLMSEQWLAHAPADPTPIAAVPDVPVAEAAPESAEAS